MPQSTDARRNVFARKKSRSCSVYAKRVARPCPHMFSTRGKNNGNTMLPAPTRFGVPNDLSSRRASASIHHQNKAFCTTPPPPPWISTLYIYIPLHGSTHTDPSVSDSNAGLRALRVQTSRLASPLVQSPLELLQHSRPHSRPPIGGPHYPCPPHPPRVQLTKRAAKRLNNG